MTSAKDIIDIYNQSMNNWKNSFTNNLDRYVKLIIDIIREEILRGNVELELTRDANYIGCIRTGCQDEYDKLKEKLEENKLYMSKSEDGNKVTDHEKVYVTWNLDDLSPCLDQTYKLYYSTITMDFDRFKKVMLDRLQEEVIKLAKRGTKRFVINEMYINRSFNIKSWEQVYDKFSSFITEKFVTICAVRYLKNELIKNGFEVCMEYNEKKEANLYVSFVPNMTKSAIKIY